MESYLCASLIILSQTTVKVLLIDNYDSFTFNLFHYLEGVGIEVIVKRNDDPELLSIKGFDKVVLSPGPGLPSEAGKLMAFIEKYHKQIPVLGVCLGMQALAQFFGDKLYNQKEVKHGVSEKIYRLNDSILFQELPDSFQVGLYHSWAVKLKNNSPFRPLFQSENNVLMAVEHQKLPLYGVQFHPESIMTEFGREIIQNFIQS